ncbi:hypothetical protein XENTR_v10004214 [Xenopus tropicalis]|nr:hypothetical protein XENTR_v10004214 [Xenopus tropicalis]
MASLSICFPLFGKGCRSFHHCCYCNMDPISSVTGKRVGRAGIQNNRHRLGIFHARYRYLSNLWDAVPSELGAHWPTFPDMGGTAVMIPPCHRAEGALKSKGWCDGRLEVGKIVAKCSPWVQEAPVLEGAEAKPIYYQC